jgi:hypothetical protein
MKPENRLGVDVFLGERDGFHFAFSKHFGLVGEPG